MKILIFLTFKGVDLEAVKLKMMVDGLAPELMNAIYLNLLTGDLRKLKIEKTLNEVIQDRSLTKYFKMIKWVNYKK